MSFWAPPPSCNHRSWFDSRFLFKLQRKQVLAAFTYKPVYRLKKKNEKICIYFIYKQNQVIWKLVWPVSARHVAIGLASSSPLSVRVIFNGSSLRYIPTNWSEIRSFVRLHSCTVGSRKLKHTHVRANILLLCSGVPFACVKQFSWKMNQIM